MRPGPCERSHANQRLRGRPLDGARRGGARGGPGGQSPIPTPRPRRRAPARRPHRPSPSAELRRWAAGAGLEVTECRYLFRRYANRCVPCTYLDLRARPNRLCFDGADELPRQPHAHLFAECPRTFSPNARRRSLHHSPTRQPHPPSRPDQSLHTTPPTHSALNMSLRRVFVHAVFSKPSGHDAAEYAAAVAAGSSGGRRG